MKQSQAQELIARAAADAIATLGKIGWSYTVTNRDGQVFTNIEPPAKKKITRPRIYNYKPIRIEERLIESHPGEELRFGPVDGIPSVYLQKAVSNYAKKVYGAGNFRTSLNKTTQEVMFIGGSRGFAADLDAAIAEVAKQTHASTNKPQ